MVQQPRPDICMKASTGDSRRGGQETLRVNRPNVAVKKTPMLVSQAPTKSKAFKGDRTGLGMQEDSLGRCRMVTLEGLPLGTFPVL